MKIKHVCTLLIVTSLVSGCSVLTVGEEEFACPGKKERVLCKGPREVYQLTNTREDLDDMMMTTEEARQGKKGKGAGREEAPASTPKETSQPEANNSAESEVVYEPRSTDRQHPAKYDKAVVVEGQKAVGSSDVELQELSSFAALPHDIAPEPLAVLKQAQVLRIYITPYTDENKDLNMPGYVYVDLEPRAWSVGSAANTAPTRIVPLEVRSKTKQELNELKYKQRGVSGLGVMQMPRSTP